VNPGRRAHRAQPNTEFSLLADLVSASPAVVVPRAEILEQLWGYHHVRAADLRLLMFYVARLRGKARTGSPATPS